MERREREEGGLYKRPIGRTREDNKTQKTSPVWKIATKIPLKSPNVAAFSWLVLLKNKELEKNKEEKKKGKETNLKA